MIAPIRLVRLGAFDAARAIVTEHGATLALVGVTLLSAALRVGGLGRKSIWFDEAVSAGLAVMPIPQLLGAATADVNPPLYYLLLHVWTPFAAGNDALLRLPSAVFSAVAVMLTVLLGRALFNARVGLIGGLFTALCAWHIDLAQEARGYGLLTCLATGSLLLLWRARSWRGWLGYALVTTLALYTHNYAVFLVLGEALYVIVTRGITRRAIVAFAVIGVLFAPWLPAALGQLGAVRDDYWIAPPSSTVLADTYFAAIAYSPPAHGWGMSVLDRAVRWGIPVLLVLASVAALRQRSAFLLVVVLATTVGVPIAISMWITPMYVVRYVAFVLPAFWLLVARGIDALPSNALRAAVGCAVAIELCINLLPLYGDPFYGRADFRSAAATLLSQAPAGTVVVHTSPFTQYPVAYYDGGGFADVVAGDEERNALQAEEFWYVRDYNVQDPAASAAADEQARDFLKGRAVLRQFDAAGVHLYHVAAAGQ
ncbi:MAG: glycosyltransferase family 39 protein [Chloroflexi bacterium]|nr:glycosyltransferase family 39 protein [Chloroflexota bacterium]